VSVLIGAVTRLVVAARDLARLVLPVECPGCGLQDEVLCESCAAALDRLVRRCEADVPRLDLMNGLPPLPVWTVADYTDPMRGVVVAWKDRGRRDLTAPLVAAARRAGREVGVALGASSGGSSPGGPSSGDLPFAGAVRVVPVPTTSRARRRRGADLVARLALAVAEGLVDAGVPAERATVLRRRAAADQVGLGARDRGRNVAGVTLRVDPGRRLHLLVDDVVTTGATLAACCRAIERAGGPVLGAVVIAATPPPRCRTDPTRRAEQAAHD
jgi:predicted amidophosphoribosyltransferase